MRGFGVAGEYPLETIIAAARAAEEFGYSSFWLSQPAVGDSLELLARVANHTLTIRLGIGAIPLTARSADAIVERVRSLGLPLGRLRLGIGSGTGSGSMQRLRTGAQELRSLLDVEICVAPLGPKMCRVAGEVADSVLLNWLTPSYAVCSRGWVREGAEGVGRPAPQVGTYVRCALGHASVPVLEREAARYGSFPHYGAHFRRQQVDPLRTTIAAESVPELQARLSQYEDVLDEVVVRAITPNDRVDETLSLVEAARPPLS